MANQAFALSPISARASLPSEEDYEAIREAFMETARGRWFLDEYARRNRNADTRMVLEAVAKVEETLAQQRQPPPPPPEDKRPALLAAIGSAVDAAEQTATAALDGLHLAESLGPIRKGARIIKEISWRWREIGADGRICDLLDSQVGAIEAGCDDIATIDPRIALREAFDTIKASISGFSDIAGAAPAPSAEAGVAEAPAEAAPEVAVAIEEPATVAEPVFESPADEAELYDEAMLERVAIEMAASDPDDIDEAFIAPKPQDNAAEPQMHLEPPLELTAQPPLEAAPVAIAPEPAREPAVPPSVMPEPRPSPPPVAAEPSLGATILATGLVTRPKIPANDPLAPIRRMTQAEKIAFFS